MKVSDESRAHANRWLAIVCEEVASRERQTKARAEWKAWWALAVFVFALYGFLMWAAIRVTR